MKRILLLTTMFIALAAVSFGQNLANSAHDFSDNVGQDASWNALTTNDMCGPCHTPHNATAETTAPLWAHTATSAAITMYDDAGTSTTFDADNSGGISGISKLCLGCHDGTVGLDNHISGDLASTNYITGSPNVGTNLENDHPISIVYNAALVTADGGLNAVSTATALGGTIESDLLFGASGSATMECASCHDPHNYVNNGKLLRIDNASSALCLECHNK